jgi:hypothetical protein
MLNFSLSGPTSYTFIQSYLTHLKPTVSNTDKNDEYKCLSMLANYLCTLSLLQDRPFSSYRTSMIAASCLCYANRLLNKENHWTNRHIQVTSYRENDLNGCVTAIDEIYRKTFHQDRTTSSILRRYLKNSKENETIQHRFKNLIHSEEDEIIDLTLDEFDEDDMSMEHYHR